MPSNDQRSPSLRLATSIVNHYSVAGAALTCRDTRGDPQTISIEVPFPS